jgi:chemotaxis protein histidine kinase CheA
MAAKDSQGLQATVIVLAILFLITLVAAIWVNNSRKTAVAQAADAQREKQEADTAQAKLQAEANTYKQWIGFDESATLETLQPMYDEDAKQFNASEESPLAYRTALQNLAEENRATARNEAVAKQDVKKLTDALAVVEAQKEAQIKQHQAELKKAADDLAAQKAQFEERYAKLNAEKDEIAAQIEADRAAHEEAVSKVNADKAAMEVTLEKREREIAKLREGVPNPDQFAQPADGVLTLVNQRTGKGYINLGSADGLRPQVTFSVVSDGIADAEAAEQKGSIEVTRILDDHMSEVTITDDDPKNPLMPGDRIYSQVWDRGRVVNFGIAGFIDLDKDRKSDLQQLKNIIAANHGRVVAAPDETGKLPEGAELQVDTRYLILGEYPSGALPVHQALKESWKTLSEQAESMGIETIALDEFVKLMGWRLDNRSIAMGPGGRAEDFAPRPREQEMPRKTGQPAGTFRKRLPGVSY